MDISGLLEAVGAIVKVIGAVFPAVAAALTGGQDVDTWLAKAQAAVPERVTGAAAEMDAERDAKLRGE